MEPLASISTVRSRANVVAGAAGGTTVTSARSGRRPRQACALDEANADISGGRGPAQHDVAVEALALPEADDGAASPAGSQTMA